MSDNEIRIAVAEALGWRFHQCGENSAAPGFWRLVPPDPMMICSARTLTKEELVEWIPNYPADLNLCAALEKTMTEVETNVYVTRLVNFACRDNTELCMQPARLRCEAFLYAKKCSLEELQNRDNSAAPVGESSR